MAEEVPVIDLHAQKIQTLRAYLAKHPDARASDIVLKFLLPILAEDRKDLVELASEVGTIADALEEEGPDLDLLEDIEEYVRMVSGFIVAALIEAKFVDQQTGWTGPAHLAPLFAQVNEMTENVLDRLQDALEDEGEDDEEDGEDGEDTDEDEDEDDGEEDEPAAAVEPAPIAAAVGNGTGNGATGAPHA